MRKTGGLGWEVWLLLWKRMGWSRTAHVALVGMFHPNGNFIKEMVL